MITTIVAASILMTGQGGQGSQGNQAPQVSPKELISKMLAKYADAKTLKGTIVLTVTAMNQTGKLGTELQLERPDRLYIYQKKSVGDGQSWLSVSDGKLFGYDGPPQPMEVGTKRLVEKVKKSAGADRKGKIGGLEPEKDLEIKDMYSICGRYLGDKSTPLDIMIARNEDLRMMTQQWVNLNYGGQIDYAGTKVHVISGQWRQQPSASPSGQYRMYITDDATLKQFARIEKVRADNGAIADVLTAWDVKVEVNGAIDPSLFKVR